MGKKLSFKMVALLLVTIMIASITAFSIPAEHYAEAHPFLLVNESEYAELQNRASLEPWLSFKSTAIADAGSLTYNTSASYVNRCTQMRDIMDSCSLSYILDTANRTAYVNKIYNTFGYWVSGATGNLYDELNSINWTYDIPPASSFFSCVIALDIIYPSLTSSQRTTAESRLKLVGDWYWANNANWHIGQWGARGIWSLYYGETDRANQAKDGYYTSMMKYFTADGVGSPGTGYSNMRFSADRNTKQYFMDVLTHTGLYNYYTDYSTKSFYEWMYGYGPTPFKIQWVYGDSAYANTFYRTGSIYKADNFSTDAGKAAAWLLEGAGAVRGRIFNYVLHRSSYPTPERPDSRIFTDGGAFFNEDSTTSTALSSVLWNCKSKGDDHAHKEVNAISLAGYGEYLLSNVGYNGWGAGITVDVEGTNKTFTWNYINNRAVSGNTALIDYNSSYNEYDPTATNDHAYKIGNGITDGFTSPVFSYASGDSGGALSNGTHIRNMVFVGPQDSKNGYWVLFDEMDATTAGNTAHIALHPPTATYTTVTSNQEYKWTLKKFSTADVYLSVFLGTAPAYSIIKNGVIGSYANSFASKYLYATYNIDDTDGKKNMVTVLFPHNSSHAKAAMARISGTGYTGASVNLDGGTTIDYALESAGTSNITYDGVTFHGLSTLYRKVSGANNFYFIRKGSKFNDGGSTRRGFDSTSDVSVYIKDAAGNITSSGSDVTFYYPGITGVKLNGSNASVISSGTNSLTVSVPAGTYNVEFTFGLPIDDAWYGKANYANGTQNLGTTNTGKLEVEFDIIPLATGLNAYTGYTDSSTNITTLSDLAMTIRMNNNGNFDVQNGAGFAATTNIPYSAYSTYHVRMITDLASKKYDVWVTAPGGSETKITDNYDFRPDAPAIDDLGKINLKDDADDRYKIENHTVIAVVEPDDAWYGKASFADGTQSLGTTNTGKLEVEFDMTPLATGLNACTGYADSSTNIATWSDPAMTIRMNNSGNFDVRNGAAFAATTNIAYSTNSTYHVRMITDLASKKYDVWITPSSGTETKITDNYNFRTDAPAMDDLGMINLKDDQNNRYKIDNHTVTSVEEPDDAWYGKSSFLNGTQSLGTGNTGRLAVEFDITPLATGLNACTGYADSSTTIDYWDDPAMTIRMNTSGNFDIRNGAAFAAATNIAYSANSTYHVRMITDLANQKYDVWITPPGGSETKIAENYAFRTGAPAIDDLGQINLKDDADDRYKVENHTISAAPVLEPVTFNPTADALVRDGSYADTEYGTQVTLAAKDGSPAGYNRKSYLKFDFGSLTASSVSQAKLRVYVYSADASTARTITAYGNITEGWSETAINWNNVPDQAGDMNISSTTANGTPTGTWLEFDVTSYINSQMTDKLVSIELKNGGTAFISFNSREASSNKPELIITPQ